MSAVRDDLHAELHAERGFSSSEIWRAAEARLDWPIERGLNTAHECADRWARDRARLAMIVRHPDGSSDRWTYAELARTSSRLASAWKAAGLVRGDRVASLVNQQVEAFIGALAAWRSGMVYVPLFVGFGTDALVQRLNGAQPAAVVVDYRYRHQLADALPLLTVDPQIYTVAGQAGRGLVKGDRSLWAEIDGHAPDFGMVETAPSDPATLIYTSGTTGAAKGCIQPHSMILTIQPFIRHTWAFTPDDMFFTGAAPGWSYGLYTTGAGPMSLGIPRVVYSGDFDPAAWLRIFDEEQVTYIAAAPSALRRLVPLAQRRGISSSIRGATSAGEPLDAPLAQAWMELTGSMIQDGYGQSESAMVLANLADPKKPDMPGALTVVPGFDIALVDSEGVEQESQGVLALRNPEYQGATGYLNRDDLWKERWRGDLFLTGDVVRRDDDGRYCFVGRDDDLIVTSGYNVGPSEVESLILAHPGVAEVAVVAAPDPARGSVVRAVIVLNGTVDRQQVANEVTVNVRDNLGRHAYPKIIDYVEELPRTDSGKIKRHELRQQTAGVRQ
ncbi:acyl--CoA ligase (plasmid) [Rhodococcus erythropolis]|uniref:acyl-CoA synthetase n=1 Tax=Rhodococcus TaxID=1827 RepID=UPI0012446676|nr:MULTISPECIES: AMP-binding protein [Rhodococcus]MCJ0949885.1 AMP-binding protein [Rhodococcus sp. ARC_M8]MCQ4152119.1 AMP-binding protein [Rhodococcus qingshengii]MDJ0441245.1 AMP-binding protein [Rhodococcus qingshengii]QEX08454.1 acyl--CoA ligase [Rhodococcus erythropolis]